MDIPPKWIALLPPAVQTKTFCPENCSFKQPQGKSELELTKPIKTLRVPQNKRLFKSYDFRASRERPKSVRFSFRPPLHLWEVCAALETPSENLRAPRAKPQAGT